MNQYKIRVKNSITGENDILTINTFSQEQAIEETMLRCNMYPLSGYEFDTVLAVTKNCNIGKSRVIISSSKSEEDINMATHFSVNWNNCIDKLVPLAANEVWSNDTYPNNGILVNYMNNTYKKLKTEKNIIETKEYGLFNTGLFTKYNEPIYAYSKDPRIIEYVTSYELGNMGIDTLPERANYFESPELLLFDWHYKINVQYKHILESEDNVNRLPKEVMESGNIVTILNGAIDTMKKRVSANYKLAIPQYFNDKVQLLLPLCLRKDNVPDLALVVTKVEKYYQGHTCLTLDMAYNNARLIAKPESNWLNP